MKTVPSLPSFIFGLTHARTRSVIQSPWWPCSVWHKCYPSGGQAEPVLSANEESLALQPVWNGHFIPFQSSFQLPKSGCLTFFLLFCSFWTWQTVCFTLHPFVIVKKKKKCSMWNFLIIILPMFYNYCICTAINNCLSWVRACVCMSLFIVWWSGNGIICFDAFICS